MRSTTKQERRYEMKNAIVLMIGLLAASTVMAQGTAKVVSVNCQSPSMMAGGVSASLTGTLEIIVSPTTGMTKVRPGSEVVLSVGGETASVAIEGVYFVAGAREYINGSLDQDAVPFSSTRIDFNDSSESQRSYIQRLNGQKIPLHCAH